MANTKYTEADVLGYISEKSEGCRIEGDSLVFPDYTLAVRTQIISCEKSGNAFSAQLIFFMDHPDFGQLLVESCVGVGDNGDEAVENAARNFIATVLIPVQSALKCEGEEFITSELMGEKHIFRVPCASGSLCMGSQFLEHGDLWEIMKDVIPQYLGGRKAYWVKLFAAMANGEIICEARVNGIVFHGLTDLLKQRLPLNGEKPAYGSYKAFVLLIQNDETYTPCPYTDQQVVELTGQALEKLKAVHDEESHNAALEEIINSAPNKSLGWELAGLVPELFCMMVIGLNENDGLIYFVDGEDKRGEIKTSQLSSYDAMARGVYSYLTEKKPSRDECINLMRSSGMFNAVQKALADGAKAEDLRCSEFMYTVGEDYKIY